MAQQTQQTQVQSSANASNQNALARMMVLKKSINRFQQVKAYANVAAGTVLNTTPLFVGLLKRFIITISGTVNNTDAANALTLSDFGLANLLTATGPGVIYTDTQNFVRVQTQGWHLDFLHRARHRRGLGEALLNTALNVSGNYGDNFDVVVAPTNIAHGANAAFSAVFEIPICYSDDDLRGGVFLGVVNATSNLQLTLNPSPIAAAGADSTNAVWYGAAGNLSAVDVTIYQEYLDQLPRDSNGALILPSQDLSTIYEVKNSSFGPLTQAQDNLFPYANFRDFLSAIVVYDHDTSANAGRTGGTDVNYLTIRSANLSDIVKYTPQISAMKTRDLMRYDLPPGVYYLGSRRQPISTLNYGNMSIVLNPITAAAANVAYVGYEDFALANILGVSSQLGLA